MDTPRCNEWMQLTALYGSDACAWLSQYAGHSAQLGRSQSVIPLLHAGNINACERTLVASLCYLRQISRSDNVNPSILSALQAAHYRVVAYYRYIREQYYLAVRALDRAVGAIGRAISMEAFLAPLALECLDLCVNRARIRRNERRWAEMDELLNIAKEMGEGLHPLCIAANGSPVFISTAIARVETAGEDLWPEGRRDISIVRRDWALKVDTFARQLLRFPGSVIEYPYSALASKAVEGV